MDDSVCSHRNAAFRGELYHHICTRNVILRLERGQLPLQECGYSYYRTSDNSRICMSCCCTSCTSCMAVLAALFFCACADSLISGITIGDPDNNNKTILCLALLDMRALCFWSDFGSLCLTPSQVYTCSECVCIVFPLHTRVQEDSRVAKGK